MAFDDMEIGVGRLQVVRVQAGLDGHSRDQTTVVKDQIRLKEELRRANTLWS